jgi:hypothetical protein
LSIALVWVNYVAYNMSYIWFVFALCGAAPAVFCRTPEQA